jgi:hypothetical protein
MRITGHNLPAQLLVQANWSIAKTLLAEVFALGPEGRQAEEDERTLLVGIDEFSEEPMMEIEPVEDEEDAWLT